MVHVDLCVTVDEDIVGFTFLDWLWLWSGQFSATELLETSSQGIDLRVVAVECFLIYKRERINLENEIKVTYGQQ